MARDLTADARDDPFLNPVLSPDGRRAVCWHHRCAAPFAYSVFDLDTGERTEIGPIVPGCGKNWGEFEAPTAWWSPDGALYAGVTAASRDGEKRGTRWVLVRWSPRDKKTEPVAELPWGTRVTAAAFHGKRFAYVLEPDDDPEFALQVRADDGAVLLQSKGQIRIGIAGGIAWDPDGTALRVQIQVDPRLGRSPSNLTHWRVEPGKPAKEISIWDFEPPLRVTTPDPAWVVEERRPKENGDRVGGLFRVSCATGEAVRIGPGGSPRRVGDVVVFWRLATPSHVEPPPRGTGPMPLMVGASYDLWAYDPKDGAVFRLTDRGFTFTGCWDIAATPPSASKGR